MIKILFLGDIVGRPGRTIIKELIPVLVAEHDIDVVVANGENSAGGTGIDPNTAGDMFASGVNIITTGNHVWKRKDIFDYIKLNQTRIIRPLNYPPGVAGAGSTRIIINKNGKDTTIWVVNLHGRTFIDEVLDCPFRVAEKFVQGRDSNEIILVDFHAEATSEKGAMGWFLDGKVTAVIGTHTHVQTADERILPQGTAFISDAGMCGAIDSILGVEVEPIVSSFLTGLPVRFEVPNKGEAMLNGVVIECDENTGRATGIERIRASL